MEKEEYLKILKKRTKESHIYKKFQQIGLDIAELLNDQKHKALYIKLAKIHNPETLLAIAKDVSLRKNIANKGGYFMRILQTKSVFKKELRVKNFKPVSKIYKAKRAK